MYLEYNTHIASWYFIAHCKNDTSFKRTQTTLNNSDNDNEMTIIMSLNSMEQNLVILPELEIFTTLLFFFNIQS